MVIIPKKGILALGNMAMVPLYWKLKLPSVTLGFSHL
jgi:hypothetical protein